MKCIIIANGIIKNYGYLRNLVNQSDVIVCADGGTKHLRKINITPDIVIGDLDSINSEDKNFLAEKRVKIIQYPEKKDFSDTELAVEWAIKNKADYITLTGTTGDRLDHTLSNIFLMKTISAQGVACRMIDDHNEIYLVSKIINLKGKPGDLLSIIPVTEKVTGLTLKGLEYPLENAGISMGSSMGISNCFADDQAQIKIKTGIILVTKSRD